MFDLSINETDNKNFYPTSAHIASKMLNKVEKWDKILSILEPSAGKGDIAAMVKNKLENRYSNYYEKKKEPDVDCIEILIQHK